MPSSQTAGMSRRDRIDPGVDGGLAAVHSGFDMQIGGVVRPYETTQFDVDSQQGARRKAGNGRLCMEIARCGAPDDIGLGG